MNPNQEAPQWAYDPPPRPQRRWQRAVLMGVLVGLVVTVLGAPLGVLWHFISPTVPVIDAGANGFVVNDPSPEEYIAADGWFTLIGFVFGLIVAIVAWLVLRRDRGPGLLLGVTLGALAAAPLAWFTGRLIGRSAYEHWRTVAVTGGTYSAPPDLHAKGALLVPAFAAVIVLTLLAGWSNDPDLERPGAKPGYGSQLPPVDDFEGELSPGREGEPAGRLSPGREDEPSGGLSPGREGETAGRPSPGRESERAPGREGGPELSSDSPAGPDPTGEPAPHAPGPAAPPRG